MAGSPSEREWGRGRGGASGEFLSAFSLPLPTIELAAPAIEEGITQAWRGHADGSLGRVTNGVNLSIQWSGAVSRLTYPEPLGTIAGLTRTVLVPSDLISSVLRRHHRELR